MEVLTIVGARPQFIKATVVSRALPEVPGSTGCPFTPLAHWREPGFLSTAGVMP